MFNKFNEFNFSYNSLSSDSSFSKDVIADELLELNALAYDLNCSS